MRATRGDLTYPISLHRYRWGAVRHQRRVTAREDRRTARYVAAGVDVQPVTYHVDRASARDRAELDGWVS